MDPVPVFGGCAKDMDVVRSSGTSGWRVNDVLKLSSQQKKDTAPCRNRDLSEITTLKMCETFSKNQVPSICEFFLQAKNGSHFARVHEKKHHRELALWFSVQVHSG